ncbi:glycosyltransferase family 2 protein [Candidatus Microgenomates bacterium]|nr:glycosyltransferase family 2 protein [Candidatus Microgenomates bacterium]
MDLSIIIVNYNTRKLLKNCLNSIFKSLEKSKLSFEVIIVDNNSTDGSVGLVKELTSRKVNGLTSSRVNELKNKRINSLINNSLINNKSTIKLIENKKNLGFGRANNQAIKPFGKTQGEQAQGEYILLLNSDTEVINNGINQLLTFIKENKEVDIAGGRLLNKDGSAQASCGPFYSLPICFLMLFLKGDRLNLTRWSPKKLREVDWVSGACLMAKRVVFEKLSFDENIFMYMDEIEFLYRAKKTGFRVFFYPQAEFFHLGAASSKEKKAPVLNIFRGLLYFYQKHHSGWRLFLLKLMLKIKAIEAYLLGVLTNNHYLKQTYAQAFILVR